MARASITFEDKPNGGVSVSLEFDPPISREGDDEPTPAQRGALTAMEAVMELAEEIEEDEEDEEDEEEED